jgi:hypothetical protein
MMLTPWKYCVALVVGLLSWSVCQAQTRPADNLLKNGDFSTDGNGSPQGWNHRTRDTGTVQVMNESGQPFVRIGIKNPGENSFVQQIVAIPEKTASVTFNVRFRHADIVKGEQTYQTGAIQARFISDGKEVGKWVDIAKLAGSSTDWKEATKTAAVPKDSAVDDRSFGRRARDLHEP